MRRKLVLFAALAAVVALGTAGCKKKKKDDKAAGSDKAAMEVMEAAMDVMGAPMDRPAPVKTEPQVEKPKSADTVTITKKPPAVGQKRVSVSKMKMHFTLDAGGKQIKFEQDGTEEKHEEVLAVQGNVITKLKVTFKTMSQIEKAQGKEKTTKLPIEGKTFVIEAKDGKVMVTEEQGKPVAAKLAALVQKEYKSFGKVEKTYEAIPTTPIKVGDKVEALATAIKDKFTEDFAAEKGEWSLSGVEVSLKEVKEEAGVKLAVFGLAANISMKRGNFSMVMNLKGVAKIRAQDGWEAATILKGPLDVMGKQNAGEMEVVETITYQ